jgi:cytochrome c biogenesis protein CcmG/thiol:disulfide interchange protein DsbE
MLAVVMSLTGLMSSCTQQKQADSQASPVLSGPPHTTLPMPPLKASADIGWVLSDGKRASLKDYQDNVLVLDFYATWCAPCRKSIPRLMALDEKYGPRGVRLVGLNVGGADDRIKVPDFAKELRIQYPLGFPDQALTDLFLLDDQTIPQTFVFDREGRLVKRFIGYDEATEAELEKALNQAVGSKQ